MRCTVPVPIPSDLAIFKIPTPFASCFRTPFYRTVYLRPAKLHAFGHGALETGFDSTGSTELGDNCVKYLVQTGGDRWAGGRWRRVCERTDHAPVHRDVLPWNFRDWVHD